MKQDLEKMMQEAPTLTLEPFAEEKPAETVKQEEVKKADEKENLRAILSPGEQEQVEAFVKQIDVTNSQLVLQYGASAQKKIADFSEAQRRLKEKLVEALQAVVPIMAIVVALCFCIAPVSPSILLCFLLGGGMLIVGMMFFTLGAELAMTPMGEKVGLRIMKSKKLWLIVLATFLIIAVLRMLFRMVLSPLLVLLY